MFEKFTSFLPIDIKDFDLLKSYGINVKRYNGKFYMDVKSAKQIVEDTFIAAAISYKNIEQRTVDNNVMLDEQTVKIQKIVDSLSSFNDIENSLHTQLNNKQVLINRIDVQKIIDAHDVVLKSINNYQYSYNQHIVRLLDEYKNNLNTKQKEAGDILLNFINERKMNIDEKFNEILRVEARKESNIRLNKIFEEIGIDIKQLMVKVKVNFADPLTIVKYTIKRVQLQEKRPDIIEMEKLRDQINKSINDEPGNTETLDAIKAMDTYTDDKKVAPVLGFLRKLQWKIEENTSKPLKSKDDLDPVVESELPIETPVESSTEIEKEEELEDPSDFEVDFE